LPFPFVFRPTDSGIGDPCPKRERHDAFNEGRKAAFLAALIKTGCLLDAARAAGVSPRTVYNHQESDPEFDENVRTALAMSATPVEMIAWRRAVVGVEQEFACGGQVHVRRRYSDHLLRLLLQGSNPRKFGPNPGFTRKRIRRHERKEMEREIRHEVMANIAAQEPDIEEVRAEILRKVDALGRHSRQAKLAAGWTEASDGTLIPPGYGLLSGPDTGAGGTSGAAGEETPRDSV
jgi:hypothetical protein